MHTHSGTWGYKESKSKSLKSHYFMLFCLEFTICDQLILIDMKWFQASFFHSNTVWLQQIWIKEKSWWQIYTTTVSKYIPKRPRICININPSFRIVFYEENLTSQHSHLEVILLTKFGSERVISIDTDSGYLCHQLFTFIQICCSHTVQKAFLR